MRKWQKIATIRDRRGHGRAAVLLRARLLTGTGEVRGFVRNLSATGAMMDAHHDLALDTKVTLRCGDRSIPARVAWAEQRRLGLRFEVPLDEAVVAALVAPRQAGAGQA